MVDAREYRTDDDFDEYEFNKKKRQESLDRTVPRFEPLVEDEVKEVPVIKKRSMPRMEETKIKPLKRDTPKVFGNLFDRVDFLKERVAETEATMKERENIHNQILQEIDVDITDKEQMATHITDLDEQRNFRLDISILRKEKRQEVIQFWRDILELRTELRELLEKLQTEEKILDAFKTISEGE